MRLLDEHGVAYILIGGLATNLHGYDRVTADMAMCYERSRHNVERLVDVLRELHATAAEGDRLTSTQYNLARTGVSHPGAARRGAQPVEWQRRLALSRPEGSSSSAKRVSCPLGVGHGIMRFGGLTRQLSDELKLAVRAKLTVNEWSLQTQQAFLINRIVVWLGTRHPATTSLLDRPLERWVRINQMSLAQSPPANHRRPLVQQLTRQPAEKSRALALPSRRVVLQCRFHVSVLEVQVNAGRADVRVAKPLGDVSQVPFSGSDQLV